ncbi:putative Srd-like anti-sigma factor [Klebsiella phage Metamorpho]|nr:putative Srd-like anti-sigma factor [Klebsiella phage Metamorpho]
MKFTAETAKVYTRLITTLGSAQRRHKDFNLTPEYLFNIMQQTHCAYSGEKFGSAKGNHPDSMTLERWNNELGYVMGNVIPVKQKYNSLRGNNTIEDLERKANETAARIVRSADSVKPAQSKEDKKFLNLQEQEKLAASLRINIGNREAHLERLKKRDNISSADLEVIAALESRILGGKTELKRVEKRLAQISSSIPKRPSDADIRVQSLQLIANSLRQLEECSMLDKLKLKKGLPLTASFFQLLRGKM